MLHYPNPIQSACEANVAAYFQVMIKLCELTATRIIRTVKDLTDKTRYTVYEMLYGI